MIETEQAVIGCLLMDWKACREPEVFPTWFERPFYQEIVRRGLALEANGIKPDPITLIEGMNDEGKAEILHCAQLVPSVSSYPHYARQLKQEWRQREIRGQLSAIQLDGNDADDMVESLRLLVSEQEALTGTDCQTMGKTLSEAYTEFYEDLFAEDIRYLSGYRQMDQYMGGLLPGSVFVLGARSGHGKTDFAISLLLRYAAAGIRVLYYSMEMPENQLMVRVASYMTGIHNTRIRDKQLTKDEQTRISRALGMVTGKDGIRILTNPPNLAELRRTIRLVQPQVLFLDHLSLMKMPHRKSRYEEVAETTRAIKTLALETGVAIVELVQMNREVERRTCKRPLLSDLKESGTIEEDADYVMFLQAHKGEEMLEGNGSYETLAYLEKNRHGRTGTTKFAWRPQYSRFTQVINMVEDRCEKGGSIGGKHHEAL